MKAAHGSVFKYGDNVDTDVIIPARYLNSSCNSYSSFEYRCSFTHALYGRYR